MKKVLLFSTIALLMVVLVVGIFSTTAKAAKEGDYTYTVANGEATITYFTRSVSGDLTIPSTLGGYPVTGIKSWAFETCKSLTTIVMVMFWLYFCMYIFFCGALINKFYVEKFYN